MNVMIRRDGRVELNGQVFSENDALARIEKSCQDQGFEPRQIAAYLKWVKDECIDGRAFCWARRMLWYDSEGNVQRSRT